MAGQVRLPDGEIDYSELLNLQPLAAGHFAKIYRATYCGTPVAVKMLLDVDCNFMKKYIDREMSILRKVRHPNIVQFMGICNHSSGLYIVTEYVSSGDVRTLLKDKTKEIPWPIRVRMAVDVSLAIFHLHSKGCIHRDLKSRNLLVDESYKVKLCDFGFSRQVLAGNSDAPMTVCGTTPWMAPEVLLGERYDMKADVFSFGMVIWELLTRDTPPERLPGQKFAVDPARLRKALPADAPEGLVAICVELTVWDAEKRPTAKEVYEKLKALHISMTGISPSPRRPDVEAVKCATMAGDLKATPAVREV